MKILIIEDNPADQNVLLEHLIATDDKMETEKCETLKDGFKFLNEKQFDLVFLDLNLPDCDGEETIIKMLNFLSDNEKNKSVAIVILTGYENYTIGKKAVKQGIKEYIIKEDTSRRTIARCLRFAQYPMSLPTKRKTS
tara:strand:- start:68 stop:481 length:414 start_codon:yes stop_codon:yes gene_type:complete